MADHYTHSAFELKATKEQYDWLSKITNIVYLIGLGDATEAQIRVFKEELVWTDDLPDFWGWLDQPVDGGVHFSMEECGNIDLMAEILKVYLGKFYPEGHVSFEWAGTCTQPRAGAFNGGAAVITADDIEFINTSTWVRDTLKKMGREK